MKINIEVNNLEELKELCAQLTGGIVVAETTPDPEPKKKATSKKKAAKKASTPSGDSTPDTEQSKPGEQQDSIEDAEEKEVSATANLHPDVTRKQVTELVKETMKKGRTDVVKTALGRINAAKVTEIPDELLGVFCTDLEALLGGE